MPVVHPDPPPSDVVVAARARLLARLVASPSPGEFAEPWPDGDDAATERYDFGEPFATGGLGVIRRANDRRLGRVVAVKELRRNDPDAERRFLLEAAITARLQHPGIVPVHDIGRFPTGEPYYCMKLVEGRSLEQVIAGASSPRERLDLLAHVLAAADAIAYAHRHGVVHRDLKPANILVGAHGETVVIDWGLAKDTTGQIAEALRDTATEPQSDATLTDVGTIVGTLRYMPPEQARGEAVDARSDVFALGAVLFHVIAGQPPHARLERAALLERVVAGRVDDLLALAPDAPRALVAIAQRAMSPRPADRYPGAGAFADDLRRFMTGRLVDAHRYQLGDLLRLWLRRYRAAAVVAALALVVLAASSLAFVLGLRAERDTAAAAQHDAERAEASAVRRADEAVLSQARATLADDLDAAVGLLGQVDLSHEINLRRARLIALEAAARGAPDRVLRGHTRPIEHIAPLSDGDVVSVDVAGEVWRWNLRTGEGRQVADLAARGVVLAAAEAPVWVALAGRRGHVFRGDDPPEEFDLGTLDPGPRRQSHRWELSRHGETLAALGTFAHMNGDRRAAAYLWDLIARPATLHTLPFDHVSTAALSPDGAAVAITGPDRRVLLVEGETVTPIPTLRSPSLFSPDGRYLIAELADGSGKVAWSRRDGSIQKLGSARILGFTADDHVLVDEVNPDKLLLIREPRFALRSLLTGETRWTAELENTNELRLALHGERGGFSVADRGDHFALHLGGTWQLWSMATGKIERRLETGPHLRGVFLADGQFAVARHTDVWLWAPPGPSPADRVTFASARDGSHAIAQVWGEGKPRLLRLADRRETPSVCIEGRDWRALDEGRGRLAVDGRGRILAAFDPDLACLEEQPGVARPIALPGRASAVELAERSDGFAMGLDDGSVLAWDRATAPPRRWQLAAAITDLAALAGGTAYIVRTRPGAAFAVRRASDTATPLGGAVDDARGLHVALHPRRDEAAIALPGEDALVFYDARSDTAIRRPLLLPSVPALAYSPSGDRFAAAVAGRGLLVLADPEDPGRELALPEEAQGLGFLDDDELAVIGQFGSLFRVDLELGETALLRRSWTSTGSGPWHVVAAPGGELHAFGRDALKIHPPDNVPRDMSDLRAWLSARSR